MAPNEGQYMSKYGQTICSQFLEKVLFKCQVPERSWLLFVNIFQRSQRKITTSADAIFSDRNSAIPRSRRMRENLRATTECKYLKFNGGHGCYWTCCLEKDETLTFAFLANTCYSFVSCSSVPITAHLCQSSCDLRSSGILLTTDDM